MNQPVIVVDPQSAGIEIAPAFLKHNTPAIAVTLNKPGWKGFGSQIRKSDFNAVIQDHPDLSKQLKSYNPLCIIPGTESAVALAEHLSQTLTPHFANALKKSRARSHKYYTQKALEQSGIPFIQTLNTASEEAVTHWIHKNELDGKPLIIKPPISAGSDKVFHIPAKKDWRPAFNTILSEPCKINGSISETVIVQEQVFGTELAVGTVSANGKHTITHLIQYHKTASGDRKTVFDYVEFLPYQEKNHRSVFEYTQEALDALGIQWGAAHSEVMLTPDGPRLIECGARLCGGPVTEFSRKATGSSQADRLVEVYLNGKTSQTLFNFNQPVVAFFLKSPNEGKLANLEAFDKALSLNTFFKKHLWFRNGDLVPKTQDYLSSLGIIALTGDREPVFSDLKALKKMETELKVVIKIEQTNQD